MQSKPTTIWLDDEDKELVAKRKEQYGLKSFSAIVRMWLRFPPKK